MARLFTTLIIGIVVAFILFFPVAHWINTYLILDVENELRAERMTAEIELLNRLAPSLSQAELDDQLDRIAHYNQSVIEEVDVNEVPDSIRSILEERTVWTDDEDFDYFVAFNPRRYFRFSEDTSRELIAIDYRLQTTILGAWLFMMALACLFWFFLLYRKLKRLETAFDAVGAGDLSARAPTERRLQVGRLNDRFNAMVDRLSHLVDSHRRLTRTVAHELRTPLFRMQLQLDFLANARPEDKDTHIQGMENNIFELQDMVDELLEFAKVERAELTLKPTDIELAPFVNNLVEPYRSDPEHTITIDYQNPSIETIQADQSLLHRALDNVIRNAINHGGPTIIIRVLPNPNALVIQVDDDGSGIDPAEAEDIFTPFHRANHAEARPGYGLGLSIAREIAQLHGGSLRWCEGVTSGTRFELVLPLNRCLEL